LQVWKGVINNSDLDDMLLLRNVRIDAEGKLDEASLRLAAQLPILHEKLDTIEDELEGSLLIRRAPNLFTSSQEILCSCVECSRLLSRDYTVARVCYPSHTTTSGKWQCFSLLAMRKSVYEFLRDKDSRERTS
jgi:hypothetical protein